MAGEFIEPPLKLLEEVISRQRARIEELEGRLTHSHDSVGTYRKLINHLYAQIDAKDAQIRRIQEDLSQSRQRVTYLTGRVESIQQSLDSTNRISLAQSETIAQQRQVLTAQTNAANTGFILIASKKELQKLGIIGKGTKARIVNSANIDPSRFMKVDMRQFTGMPLKSSRVKILSSMPSGSYQLIEEENGTRLDILDPGRFWSVTAYLIIQL